LILDNALVKNGDWEYPSGYACMKELLELPVRPTALFAMNDLMAVGAMDAVKDAGLRIPEDISVIGFDNREIASYVSPRLTTVAIDLKGIGLAAAEAAIKAIRDNAAAKDEIVIPCKLIDRGTVAINRRNGFEPFPANI
jgi:LacI family transcriptional regulator